MNAISLCVVLYALFLGFLNNLVYARQSIGSDNVVCFTLPKSGSHLLTKCLNFFKQPGLYTGYKTPPRPNAAARARYALYNRYNPPHHYKGMFHIPTVGPISKKLILDINRPGRHLLWSHWPYTPQAESYLQDKTVGNFFLIRDPRDLIVSMAYMVKDDLDNKKHAKIEDLIFDFIDGRKKHFIRWGVEVQETYPLLWELGVVGFYNLYLPWISASKFMTVRFEDLVGSKGGGSDAMQFETIKNMAKHIHASLTDEEIREIQKNLFGGSGTFREGQIGSWRKHFTVEMIAAFKKARGACQLLIDLGYEKDSNW